jgi:hypothetical protein
MPACPNCGHQLAPMKGANLDDLMTLLLGAVRDALDAGYVNLAAMVVHLLVEHRGRLGLRSRTYTKLLRDQLADARPPTPAADPGAVT